MRLHFYKFNYRRFIKRNISIYTGDNKDNKIQTVKLIQNPNLPNIGMILSGTEH